jgi:hypothetical protein
MHLKWQPGLLAGPLDQPIEAFPIERCAALPDADVPAVDQHDQQKRSERCAE